MEISNKKNVRREVLGLYELLDKNKRKKNHTHTKPQTETKTKNVLQFFISNFNFFYISTVEFEKII